MDTQNKPLRLDLFAALLHRHASIFIQFVVHVLETTLKVFLMVVGSWFAVG